MVRTITLGLALLFVGIVPSSAAQGSSAWKQVQAGYKTWRSTLSSLRSEWKRHHSGDVARRGKADVNADGVRETIETQFSSEEGDVDILRLRVYHPKLGLVLSASVSDLGAFFFADVDPNHKGQELIVADYTVNPSEDSGGLPEGDPSRYDIAVWGWDGSAGKYVQLRRYTTERSYGLHTDHLPLFREALSQMGYM